MEIAIATLNCAQKQQRASDIQRIIYASVASFTKPDVVVLGIQELAPLRHTLLNTTADYIKPIVKGIEAALQEKYPQTTYKHLAEQWTGGIGLLVFSRHQAVVTSTFTDFGNYWSSAKGAVASKLSIGGATYTFVGTHLPAHQGPKYVELRNECYKILANGLVFEDQKNIYDSDHLFVLGDLNYRATLNPESDSLLADFDWEHHDELTIEKQKGQILWGLHEHAIKFEPTFKYYPDSQSYNYKRTPAWTDRILYSDAASVKEYSCLQDYTTTDHRPVYLSLIVQPNNSMARHDVPAATVCPKQVSVVVDKALGSGIYLTTTKIGWGILAVMVVGIYLLL